MTYQTHRGPMTRDEIIARATHYHWTKGEVLELPVVRSYSETLYREIKAEGADRDPFEGFGE